MRCGTSSRKVRLYSVSAKRQPRAPRPIVSLAGQEKDMGVKDSASGDAAHDTEQVDVAVQV